jgi:Ion channel
MAGVAERARRLREHPAVKGEYAYAPILILILISLAFQLAAPETEWARLVTIVLQGVTLLAALHVSDSRPAFLRAAYVAVVVAIVGGVGVVIGPGQLDSASGKGMTLLLVAGAPVAIASGIVRQVREDRTVVPRTMFGVLCIYLLVGMAFAFGFAVVNHVSGEPFFNVKSAQAQSDFLYFSFATITTTGYGDLVAVTNLGRSLAITEALIGQIYLVTVVAVIVGNLRPRRRSEAGS